MWTILKYDKKRINCLKEDLTKKFGNDFKIYNPKIYIEKRSNKKVLRKEFSILGDYLFCFHNDFKDSNTLKSLSNLRGLKYFLAGFKETQNDINSFILKCKESENEKGYLSSDFYDLKTNSIYKLVSGPFANSIFKLVKLQKNKIDILMGNIKTTIKKKDFLFQPV